jgi:hypothetical protein
MMPLQQTLMNEIFRVTAQIQDELPELYKLLNETPLFLNRNERDITIGELAQYLESLNLQLFEYTSAPKKIC